MPYTSSMATILLYVATALSYLAVAALMWHTYWRSGRAAGPDGSGRAPGALLTRWSVLLPLLMHGALLYPTLLGNEALRFGFGQALSVMFWLAIAIYWLESFVLRLEGMQALLLPMAAVAALLPAAFPGFTMAEHAQTIGFRTHLVLAMAAYSFFTIAALQAVLMSFVERRLHAASIAGPLGSLPPLLTLERMLFRLLGAGFVLLTLTIATGAFFSEDVFGRAFRFDHKTLFALISWLIFAALLAGRQLYGWRGRVALRWIFAGFMTLLLAYVGSRFVLEVILQRVTD